MVGRESNGTGAGPVPGQRHFPLPKDRRQRLQVLADLARRGLYCPDYEKLANALIDKEPDLFRLDNLGADPCPEERNRKDGAQEAPSPGENSR